MEFPGFAETSQLYRGVNVWGGRITSGEVRGAFGGKSGELLRTPRLSRVTNANGIAVWTSHLSPHMPLRNQSESLCPSLVCTCIHCSWIDTPLLDPCSGSLRRFYMRIPLVQWSTEDLNECMVLDSVVVGIAWLGQPFPIIA